MPYSNPLLERLAIKLPVIQAPMAGVSTPLLAASVSNAGGLGSIALGALTAAQGRRLIRETRKHTQQPFNVNFFCHRPAQSNEKKEQRWLEKLRPLFSHYSAEPPKGLREIYPSFTAHEEMFQMLLEEQPMIVSFHFGLPETQQITALKNRGIFTIACATNSDEAGQIEAAGIDAVVLQGWEAGGHRGCFNPDGEDKKQNALELVKAVANNISIPVIAAGGIMNGHDIKAALQKGAMAAQLGTAFLTCPENALDPGYEAALSQNRGTVMTRAISGRPARCLINKFTEFGADIPADMIPDYPVAYDAGKALNLAAKTTGEHGFGAQWAGAEVGRLRTMPAAALMKTLERELLAVNDACPLA